jgi:hypothetical protein
MAEYRMETSPITQKEKVQNSTIHRKTHAFIILGLTRTSTETSTGEGHNNEQCSLQ